MRVWKAEIPISEGEYDKYTSIVLKNKESQVWEEFVEDIWSGNKQYGKYDNIEFEVVINSIDTDFPLLWGGAGVFVISERVKMILGMLLKECVEFIPIKIGDSNYYLTNIIKILDAVNYDQAKISRTDRGIVDSIDYYAFEENVVRNVPLFKVWVYEQIYKTEIFVTETFKKTVEDNKLTGIRFIEVWDSEK